MDRGSFDLMHTQQSRLRSFEGGDDCDSKSQREDDRDLRESERQLYPEFTNEDRLQVGITVTHI